MRARRERRVVVEEDKKILQRHTPPRIEPVIARPVPSKRAEKEKQVPLFALPAPGVKASQITNLQRDLARSLSVVSLRVVENIPGKTSVGIEIPNESRETIRLSEVRASQVFRGPCGPLSLG